MELVHATVVQWRQRGLLLRGPSGAGKSDLALRLIEAGGMLVGDDYVRIERDRDHLVARPVDNIAGLMEVRGVGLVEMPHLQQARLDLLIDLQPDRAAVERLPDPAFGELSGVRLPRLAFYAFEASAVAKLGCALEFLKL